MAVQTATIAWGPTGVEEALGNDDLIVVVDVLRFSSTTTTAIANGFTIVASSDPHEAKMLSGKMGIPVSGKTGIARYSLSPLDYLNPKDTEVLILVSPNGAACKESRNVTLIAAGEVSEDQQTDLRARRFAIEDYLGCGAILSELRLDLTPEATLCERAYEASKMDYVDLVRNSISGRYLVDRGHDYDISHCVQKGTYQIVPVISNGTIVRYAG